MSDFVGPVSGSAPARRAGANRRGVLIAAAVSVLAVPVLLLNPGDTSVTTVGPTGEQAVATSASTESTVTEVESDAELLETDELGELLAPGARDMEELDGLAAGVSEDTVTTVTVTIPALETIQVNAPGSSTTVASTASTSPRSTASESTSVVTTAAPTTAAPTTAAPTTAAPETTAGPVTTAEPETTAAPDSTAGEVEETTTTVYGPTAEQWSDLRDCESTNRYGVVDPTGRYYGAYQFWIPTWDDIAARHDRPDLVGVPPNEASNADQDQMAFWLWEERGPNPWPKCGRVLPPAP